MPVLPAGFALPPLPYLVGLLLGLGAVGTALALHHPQVGGRHVLALVPWMVAGAVGHVLYVLGALPPALSPLAGTPAVYATVGVLAGGTWAVLASLDVEVARPLGLGGSLLLLPALSATVAVGAARGTLSPLWPGVGVVVAVVVAMGAWLAVRRYRPRVEVTGHAGPLVLFAHALDGVSTAVGVDVLQYGERTPLPRLIIAAARSLPTAEFVGAGWLFVAVKVALASLIVVYLADLVRDDPTRGNLLLGLVAAVGLGPGTHNLVLFAVA